MERPASDKDARQDGDVVVVSDGTASHLRSNSARETLGPSVRIPLPFEKAVEAPARGRSQGASAGEDGEEKGRQEIACLSFRSCVPKPTDACVAP
jgi:hypothetical protein